MAEQRKATILLEHCLKQLKLPTMLRDHASVAAICGRENVSFETFLLRLCERELVERQQRATERRIKAAKFPTLKTIESFRFDAQPSINEVLIHELLTGEFIDRRENVLLIGNSGTGKTHLATALALAINELIQNALEHAFVGRVEGAVQVQLRDEGEMLSVSVFDNGVGLAGRAASDAGQLAQDETSLGLEIVQTLVKEDLKGSFITARTTLAVDGGEILFDRFYVDLNSNGFSSSGQVRYDVHEKSLQLSSLRLGLKDILTLSTSSG